MSKIIHQRIIYSQMSKNDDYQSIRTKGALHSFTIMNRFLNDLGEDVRIATASLHASVWEQNDRNKVKIAKAFLSRLYADLGKPSDPGAFVESGSFNDWIPYSSIERYPSWDIDPKEVTKSLKYIDDSQFAPELSSRPPLSLMASVDFRLKLKHTSLTNTPISKSSAFLFLSQSSNSISLLMTTPYTEHSKEFEAFRAHLQSFSPIELKDKYFYLEKIYPNDKVTYRKLYTSSSA